MPWIRDVADRITSRDVRNSLDEISRLFVPGAARVQTEIRNFGAQLRDWRSKVAGIDPSSISAELWGEAGRFAYTAAAGVMAARSPSGIPISNLYKRILRPHFGKLVDSVVLHWGVAPLDEWAADRCSIKLEDVDTAAQTFGEHIYIRAAQNMQKPRKELALLVHELVHSEQFVEYGKSLSNFGYHYFKEYKKGGQSYSSNKLERDAEQRTRRVVNAMPIRPGKSYMFKGSKYVRFDSDAKLVDAGYPSAIRRGWPGVTFPAVDAIVRRFDKGKVYFFCGDNYTRFDINSNVTDPGYPKRISVGWPGVTYRSIDAATMRPDKGTNGKIYFFNGDEYVRFDLKSNRVDPGYPAKITRGWPGIGFSSIDAAVFRSDKGPKGKIYFFKGNKYTRFDLATSRTDSGYPARITRGWPGVFPSGLNAAIA